MRLENAVLGLYSENILENQVSHRQCFRASKATMCGDGLTSIVAVF